MNIYTVFDMKNLSLSIVDNLVKNFSFGARFYQITMLLRGQIFHFNQTLLNILFISQIIASIPYGATYTIESIKTSISFHKKLGLCLAHNVC